MRHSDLILLLAILFFGNYVNAFADNREVNLSSELIGKVIEGHKFIEQSTVCLSGTIISFKRVYVKSDSDIVVISFDPQRQFQFYKNHDLARVEYIQPKEGTQIVPDHKYNDITEILLRTKNYDYYYDANDTTGNPSADVTRSKIPGKFVDARLQMDLYLNTGILTTLTGGKIIEVLQRPIGKVESRECEGTPNALWITGLETISKGKNGDNEYANWSIVFDPNRYYALLRHEFYLKDKNNDYLIHVTVKVDSQMMDNGTVVPKEIVEECYTKVHGRFIDRCTVNITSTEIPEDALFSEGSFKETGRNYTLIEESPDGRPISEQYIDVPQPWLKTPRNHNEVSFIYYIDWTRVCFALIGFLMLLIAFFLFRRSKKNKNNL
ncbi:MAG: hypothetical protein LBC74_03900 [Planctomycetaceae bacterium]|jgi:hypothetical protein|nr:hypothetical protein [Planctomycetaceae bacterium]